jgi:hypothetical protein
MEEEISKLKPSSIAVSEKLNISTISNNPISLNLKNIRAKAPIISQQKSLNLNESVITSGEQEIATLGKVSK